MKDLCILFSKLIGLLLRSSCADWHPLLGRDAVMTGPTDTAVGGRRLRRLAGMFAVTTDVYLIKYNIVS